MIDRLRWYIETQNGDTTGYQFNNNRNVIEVKVLLKDFYKPRWERWINDRINELEGKDYEEKISWFPWEWQWARSNTAYSNAPKQIDLFNIAKTVLQIL